jgi:PPOX class probable F420-dependent enzyme
MAIRFGPRLQAFLDEKQPVVIGTQRQDGTVQLNPIWYESRDGQIWLNGGPRRDWVRHLQRDPRVTLLMVDPQNQFRWAQIQGRLADTSTAGADDHIDRLSQRYFGRPYPADKNDRLIVRVDPERVTGAEDGKSWDTSEGSAA